MNETILDISTQNSVFKTVSIHRTPDCEYIINAQRGDVIQTWGPWSAVETIQCMMRFFQEPLRERVIAQAFPTFGGLSNIRVDEVGPGLYDVVIGVLVRVKRFVSAEEVMKTLGHYLEKGGKAEPYVPPNYDETFWEIQRLLDLDDRGEDEEGT